MKLFPDETIGTATVSALRLTLTTNVPTNPSSVLTLIVVSPSLNSEGTLIKPVLLTTAIDSSSEVNVRFSPAVKAPL